MKPLKPVSLLAVTLAATALSAQPLTCPATASVSGRPCEIWHYHVQMYRPDTKGFADLFGLNGFSTQAACERAREVQSRSNLAVVEYFKRVKNEQQYEPDRLGACHCDMSLDKTSPNYLTDAQRTAQKRMAQEIRLRVREKLLDSGLSSDAEQIRGLNPPATGDPLLSGPRLAPLPGSAPVAAMNNAASDLRATRQIDTSKPAMALSALDLPLVDVTLGTDQSGPPAPASATAVSESPSSPATSDPSAAPPPDASPATAAAPPPAPTPSPAPAPAPAPSESEATVSVSPDGATEVVSAEDAAESFISYETQRIQNVLKASSAIADETIKSKIFEATIQRSQLLSNLRLLIEGSGMRSRLATAARGAQTEADRLALVRKLFGNDIAPHWAPKDATEVILETAADIDHDPERVLRDSSGKYSDQQKRRALYLMLARTQPTEEQQLWLSSIMDGFLQ